MVSDEQLDTLIQAHMSMNRNGTVAALEEFEQLREAVREWFDAGRGDLEAYNAAREKLRAIVPAKEEAP